MFWITDGLFISFLAYAFVHNVSVSFKWLSTSLLYCFFFHCIVLSVMIVITVSRFLGYVSLLCLFQNARKTCYFMMTSDNKMFSSVHVWQITLTLFNGTWFTHVRSFRCVTEVIVLSVRCYFIAFGPLTQSRPKLCISRLTCFGLIIMDALTG